MASILIVDDDEMQRVLLRSALSDKHDLFFAGDGQVALKIFDEETINLVITDLAMPNLNGLRLIRELRKKSPFQQIIAISGVAADQLDLAEDYGAYATLFKPVEKEDLLRVVADALLAAKGRRGTRPRS